MTSNFGRNAQTVEYELSCNLVELPLAIEYRLSEALNFKNLWMRIIDDSMSSAYYLRFVD